MYVGIYEGIQALFTETLIDPVESLDFGFVINTGITVHGGETSTKR